MTQNTDEQKKINCIRAKRCRQRRRLKLHVANFCNKLQSLRGACYSRSQLSAINREVRAILKLPYRWTEKDLQRAENSLTVLETKYLGKICTDNKSQIELQNSMIAMLRDSNFTPEQKNDIALEILRSAAQELFLQKADKLEPSNKNLLILLTQPLENAVPAWFNDQIIALIKEKYTGVDTVKMLTRLRKTLEKKHLDQTWKKTIENDYAAENSDSTDIRSLLGL